MMPTDVTLTGMTYHLEIPTPPTIAKDSEEEVAAAWARRCGC